MSGREPQLEVLTEHSFYLGVSQLTARDPGLAQIVAQSGNPPFWTYPPGFPGITLAILGQQVSSESARATFGKLENALSAVTPDAFLGLSDVALRGIGFSRQKASYVRQIASDLVAARIDLEALERVDDAKARARLMQLRGVGRWTADAYLLFALKRPDAWPSGDLALEVAVSELRGHPVRLATDAVDRIATDWSPLRAVAARMLWCHYLQQRGRLHSA